MKTARLVKIDGDARFYKLSSPTFFTEMWEGERRATLEVAVVNHAFKEDPENSGQCTIALPTYHGKVTIWQDLAVVNGYDKHEEVLLELGYKIEEKE